MGKLYNQKSQNEIRRKLRHEMPKAEMVLWSQLRAKKIKNCKFRRQYGIGKFVVDFYAPRHKLAIELDGDSHFESEESEKYDKMRQKFIESFGIKILRFTNNDIYESLEHVVEIITNAI
ncbi:MAG: endonuclease domain-containing protein [bacterium]|nr:endonuclease domain-containing protein [bacterium]